MTTSLPILGLTRDAFTGADGRLADYRRVFRDGALPDGASLPDVAVARVQEEGETTKFALRLPDGVEVESVILPQTGTTGRRRVTLCVSSQVGCAMGCTFCETAQMGLLRNLSVEEIVAQWHVARFEFDENITNIVFMGMGEPLDNVGAVIESIRILSCNDGPAIPSSRITVSTVGRVEGIRKLAVLGRETGFRNVRLAVSLNAPNDDIRSSIMPLNKSTSMQPLMDAMLEWSEDGRRRVLVEYVLIPGVNDDDAHAAELATYLDPLACAVNVIPYNPRRDSPWPAPVERDVDRFIDALMRAGVHVRRRRTMGRGVMAACGQLGNPEQRRKRRQSRRTQ